MHAKYQWMTGRYGFAPSPNSPTSGESTAIPSTRSYGEVTYALFASETESGFARRTWMPTWGPAERNQPPMNAKRPAEARREETPGGRLPKRSQPRRQTTAVELAEALELVPRLQAIVDSSAVLDDADMPAALAAGLLEDLSGLSPRPSRERAPRRDPCRHGPSSSPLASGSTTTPTGRSSTPCKRGSCASSNGLRSARPPGSETEREGPAELLERHGRAYGGLRLAVAFTAGLEAMPRSASRRAAGTRPVRSPTPTRAPRSFATEASIATPAIVLRPSGLVGIDVDGPEGLELLRRIVPEGLPRTAAVETGKQAGYHLHYLAPEGSRSAFVELGPEGVTVKGEPVPRRAAERSPLGPCLSVRRRPRAVGSWSSPRFRSRSSCGSSGLRTASANSVPSPSAR